MKYLINLFILITMSCCVKNTNYSGKEDANILITCMISETGLADEIYTINIYNDSTYKIMFGEKNNNDTYNKIIKEDTIRLKNKDFQSIKYLCNQCAMYPEVKINNIKKGTWEIMIMLDNKKFNFYLGEQENTIIYQTFNKIVELSPLTIELDWR